MRNIKQFINHFRYIRSNKVVVASLFTLALVVTAGVGIYKINQENTYAADCSDNSIVRCGYGDMNGLAAAYNSNQNGDVRAIYDHYWVRPTLAPGERAVMGIANNRGEVIAEGRVVGTNAQSIGRQAIQGNHTISIAGKTYYETSHVGGTAFAPGISQLPALVVLDAAGNPKYAVLTDCGNPIYFTPVMVPPKPQPKDIQVCDITTKQIVTIKEDQFIQGKHSKNLADCAPKPIQACDLTTKQVVTITEDKFDTKRYSKNLADCKPKSVQVCDLTTKKYPVTVTEDQLKTNATKYSTNPADCKEAPKPQAVKINVCDLTTKKIITIDQSAYDVTKHSKTVSDCDEKCAIPGKEHLPKNSPDCVHPVTPVTPAVAKPTPTPAPAPTPISLPKTGISDTISAGLGLVSMTVAAIYYAMSRRS